MPSEPRKTEKPTISEMKDWGKQRAKQLGIDFSKEDLTEGDWEELKRLVGDIGTKFGDSFFE